MSADEHTEAAIKAEVLREVAEEFRTIMANAWGGPEVWITTGTKVANLAAEFLDDIAAEIEDSL